MTTTRYHNPADRMQQTGVCKVCGVVVYYMAVNPSVRTRTCDGCDRARRNMNARQQKQGTDAHQ